MFETKKQKNNESHFTGSERSTKWIKGNHRVTSAGIPARRQSETLQWKKKRFFPLSFAHVQCLFRFWLRMRTVWIWNDSSKSLSVLCGGLPVWGRASIAYQIHSPRVNSRFHRKNKKWTHIIHNSVDVVDRINVISFVGSQYIYIFFCTWSYLFRGKGRHGRYDLAATISHRRSNKHI